MSKAPYFLAAAAMVLSGAAPAPNQPNNAPTAANDPMQKVICEKQSVVGSRLATKRVCKTRAQWEDERLQTRQEIDKQQTMRGRRDDG
jgi:hypothetical protein